MKAATLIISLSFCFLIFCSQTVKAQAERLFPSQYDLRSYGYVTPVKDQGSCGCCWAFATMAAVESNWLVQGYGSYDLSEDNLINCQNYDNTPCYGGNFYMSSSMFGRHAGPVDESLDPYGDTTAIKNCPTTTFGGLPPVAYIPDVRFLPNDISSIKGALQDHGAVATTMMFDMSYYNAVNYTYLYGGSGGYPHCITVVGWDDNMSTASSNPGAWIIKDSYGTGWANNGYFYISYDDPVIFTEAAIFPVRYPVLPDNTTREYYYDEFGWITDVGFSSTTGYGLSHFIMGEGYPDPTPQQIKRIGTYAVEAGTMLEVEIYESFNGSSLSGLRFQTSMSCDYAGFYTIPVQLSSDTIPMDVYVKVKYICPSTNTPVPVEAYEANYTSGIMLQTGRNWMSGDGNTWNAVGNNTSWAFDLCIKMYTETAPLANFLMPDSAIIHQAVQLSSNCFPPDAIDSIQWFVNGEYIGQGPLMNYAFTSPGDNLVSLTAFMGNNSDTEERYIYIKDPTIISIYPNVAMQGENLTATIQGHETSWAATPQVYMSYSGNPSEVIMGESVNVNGLYSIDADFNIPDNASIGDWDVFVDDLVLENGFYVDILWDIHEHGFKNLSIYPNPSTGELHVFISEDASLEVLRTTGEVVIKSMLVRGNNQLHLHHLPAGIYLVKIYSDSKTHYHKLLLK